MARGLVGVDIRGYLRNIGWRGKPRKTINQASQNQICAQLGFQFRKSRRVAFNPKTL
jgi:hypothetical protein